MGEVALTCTLIAFTLAMTGLVIASLGGYADAPGANLALRIGEATLFGLIVLMLVYGGLVYQWARAGYFWRLSRRYAQDGDAAGVDFCSTPQRPLAILIPAYREETTVIRQTVVSAALMEHPNRRIVVLLDDPPRGAAAEIEALIAARRTIEDLDNQFRAATLVLDGARRAFHRRTSLEALDLAAEQRRLAELHRWAAHWIEAQGAEWAAGDGHPERFLAREIIARRVAGHRDAARRLDAGRLGAAAIENEYAGLASRFAVEIASFERKRYANLSHAPNKAMNLNAYIGLIGGAYREVAGPDGLLLEAADVQEATLIAPVADYLLTLDADSMVLPDYAAKLVATMEADNRIAVAQTPYSAFPGASAPIERVAGATTDLQYIGHQGASAFGAAYWVGANALLRREALEDIRSETVERGRPVPVFIQDRTVIEDTGSTVDLIARGWQVHNHPERLAYSATPPDFGSLIVQRRRWSNGGLIILPDLLRHALGRGEHRPPLTETLMRVHYLVSPATANLGLLSVLLVPFDPRLASIWLPLSAAPYYVLYARDLKQSGYRLVDLVRVYALNLLLLPVNLAGVVDCLRQLFTRRKAPFARTPKVDGRTSAPGGFVAVQFGAVAFLAATFVGDVVLGKWSHAAFSGPNCVLFAYGVARFIGWREAREDLAAAWAARAQADAPRPPNVAVEAPIPVAVEHLRSAAMQSPSRSPAPELADLEALAS
jgi:cellulose synthase/poly-beta-1,6-N-acetylglucosamine synthase-like glycosyltransferase